MPKILMLLDNPYTNDRRVEREAETIAAAGYNITLLACKASTVPDSDLKNGVKIERIFDTLPLFDIKNKSYKNDIVQYIIAHYTFDIIHSHDREMLHIASLIKRQKPHVKIVHDAHEMHFSYPMIKTDESWFITFKTYIVHHLRIWREKKDARAIDYFITVNESLRRLLTAHFKLNDPGITLRNVPEIESDDVQRSNIIRSKFNIPDHHKILVFIGSNVYPKILNVEQVMDEVCVKKDLSFVFICADNANKKKVEEYALSKKYSNVYFHPLLKTTEINAYLSSCDIGLVPTWNKDNLSYWYALDNKLFEYMMAEIPILATIQPEYKLMVEDHNIGICVNPDEKNAYLLGLNQIIDQYDFYTSNMKAAKAKNNWEIESKKLIELYRSIPIS
jgi:glycosyltransferase involved in cell wall biosynthesis